MGSGSSGLIISEVLLRPGDGEEDFVYSQCILDPKSVMTPSASQTLMCKGVAWEFCYNVDSVCLGLNSAFLHTPS